MRDGMNHPSEMRRYTPPTGPPPSRYPSPPPQPRRKSAPGGDHRQWPHDDRRQRRRQSRASLPPPPRLSIAEQFMAQDRKEPIDKKEDIPPQRLSIAERFMLATGQQKEEDSVSDHDNNSHSNNESSEKPMIRSTSGLSRLLSFNIMNIKASESHLSLGSASAPSADVRLPTKIEPQPRPHRNRVSHHCHCHCSPPTSTATPVTTHLDLEKSKLEDENDRVAVNTRRIKRKRRTVCVITVFVVLIAGAITAFLTWPRTPLIRIDGASLLEDPKITETQYINAGNVAFESTWQLEVTLDSRQNYIPLRFTMETVVKDSLTGDLIGRQLDSDTVFSLPPRMISNATVPVHIDYEARAASDPTFASLRRACTENGKEALQLQFWITIHVAGLEWIGYKPSIVATPATGGLRCPTKKV